MKACRRSLVGAARSHSSGGVDPHRPVLYLIDDAHRTVEVTTICHRADACRSSS
ncbi:hypothetical protein Rhow_000650 [Rhodococcus wratislaviensis]|uniref:Uncharacterized protein n=1 Tax=Rhodococcus wratislaviensis TaxID=44752 RepID=A0A402C2E3_RHOWR|nr:hypothetical protein Rhow_000650 [Rhodococcus wratislaviensis]